MPSQSLLFSLQQQMNSHCYSVTEQNWMSSASLSTYKYMHGSKKGYSNRLVYIHGFSDI